VVQEEGRHLAQRRLAHTDGGLPARVAQLAAHVALGVVGREGLLVAGLEDGGLLARLL
jgi:hypothetical protein